MARREFPRAERELGYIARRPDLRSWPYGWKPPRVVKVTLNLVEVN